MGRPVDKTRGLCGGHLRHTLWSQTPALPFPCCVSLGWLENVSVLLVFLDESLMKSHLKKSLCIGGGVGIKTAQQVKVLATTPDDLSSIPGTHRM